jgi:glyoxylate reductase
MRISLTRRLPISPELEARLGESYREVRVLENGRPLHAEELRNALRSSDAVICTVTDRVDEASLAEADRLKHLVTFSVGLDHLDLGALQRRGIKISHTPAVLTDATADLTWALLLGAARKVKPALHYVEDGSFRGFDPTLFLGLELRGATLGIVGFGKIGFAVARRALPFGMQVLFTSSKPFGDVEAMKEVALEELLRRSDVVSLHCPLTPATRHLIGRRELGIMKPGAVLINTARGPIIDEKALLAHLRSHPDFSAALDVYELEPSITAGLRELPNALLLPHIGSATHAARGAMARICVEEAIRFAKGERLQYGYEEG